LLPGESRHLPSLAPSCPLTSPPSSDPPQLPQFQSNTSPIFRDAHALNNGKAKITFSDPTIETAAVLRLWLLLASQGIVPITKTLPNVKDLALFFLKWDMESSLNHLGAHLEIAVRRNLVGANEAFAVAANAGDVALCELILDISSAETYPSMDKGKLVVAHGATIYGKPGQNVWDPRHWSAAFWDSVPQRYLFALSRAYGDHDLKERGLASGFTKYLARMGEKESKVSQIMGELTVSELPVSEEYENRCCSVVSNVDSCT
jgi:hypothetical protein